MHRRISVSWWRRWAGWSVAWVLGWLLVLLVFSGGPAYAPGRLMSVVLPIIFGLPVLVLCARWSIPRLSYFAVHNLKAGAGDRNDRSNKK